MNKQELITEIAEAADISKKNAGDALDGFMKAVADSLSSDDNVKLTGFGTFSTAKRAARTARNPQTGKEMKVPAKTVVKFKAGSKLADAVK